MKRRNLIVLYALASLLITFVLAFFWEFGIELGAFINSSFVHVGETDTSRWMHVGVITFFAYGLGFYQGRWRR